MPITSYGLGQSIRVRGKFIDPENDDAPIDPDTIKLFIRTPDGEVTAYEYDTDEIVERDEEGSYSAVIIGDQVGRWYYRWASEGNGQAPDEQSFEVKGARAVEPEEP